MMQLRDDFVFSMERQTIRFGRYFYALEEQNWVEMFVKLFASWLLFRWLSFDCELEIYLSMEKSREKNYSGLIGNYISFVS